MKIHAPEVGRQWFNSLPLTIAGLRGSVVLVDFWDYTCVNCLRTIPYLIEWDRRYRGNGLVVIGVHAPEFQFARSAPNVARAVQDLGIKYPVVLDNEYQIWSAYSNRCWPAKYLIDGSGYVRYYHYGEGGYHESEEAIQKLLLEIAPGVSLPRPMAPLRGTDDPGARCAPVTPELYLGFKRGRLGNESGYAANEVRDYSVPRGDLAPDIAWLDGPWFASEESVEACPLDGRPARLMLKFRGAELNLVMSPPDGGHAAASVLLNGKPLSGSDAGEDVVRRSGRDSVVEVSDPRMYRLVKGSTADARLIEVSTHSPGLGLYAFTFVSCVEGAVTPVE
ncbi:MAG: redoxin family protein [Acidobacteriota bacterium]|nr:redoxin family protein [Acidobacteriota bacterium]